jgi:DNA-binding response OmpR family regulator
MEYINDILVVDDDTALVDFVVSALREAGYVACAAYDGESALLAIETARPALVLLDLHLPGLSGVDVVTHLRRHDLADVPVILMTGDAPAAARLPTAEFPEYLLKAFNLDTLLACIRRYVRRQHGISERSRRHRYGLSVSAIDEPIERL